jgi:anti-sigma B factor antagonist
MRVKVQKTDGTGILSLEGDLLGEDDYRKLRGRVCDLVEHGRKDLILDLTHVEHINSCGLGALVCAFTTARRAGGQLRLTGAGVHIRKILGITHLNKVFQIYPSVSAARKASGD